MKEKSHTARERYLVARALFCLLIAAAVIVILCDQVGIGLSALKYSH